MKRLFILTAVALFSLNMFAQRGEKSISGIFAYGLGIDNMGAGLKLTYGLTDQLRLAPSGVYYFKKNNQTAVDINLDANYLCNLTKRFTIYPLAGLLITNWHTEAYSTTYYNGVVVNHPAESTLKLGLNMGAGMAYRLVGNLSAGTEFKYCMVSRFDQFVISANLTYKF